MPSLPPRRCPGCGQPVLGRCPDCMAESRRRSDARRGTSTQRGYGPAHRQRFRPAVLARDPVCVACRIAPSTVADHFPRSRRELVAAGEDPDDPAHGRGLCKPCHDRWTAHAQPGHRYGRPPPATSA